MDHSTRATLKGAPSPLDWCHHAIDVHADHPVRVLIARCGHRLLIVTALDADRPGDPVCATCSRWTTRVVHAANHPQVGPALVAHRSAYWAA